MVIADFSGNATMRTVATSDPRESLCPGFATPGEAARFLHLSKAMVHKLIGDGKIPASRYGRAVRIPWKWLKEQAGE